MRDVVLSVKYVTVQHCFVYLPDEWLRRLVSKPNILKLTHGSNDYYLSWQSIPSPDQFLRISATFARSLNIKDGDQVFVSCETQLAPVASAVVAPRTNQDWEIVELQSNKIQASVLEQISIVARNQNIIVWISKTLSVTLIVDSLEPNYKFGKLEQFTELVVSPPKFESISKEINKKPEPIVRRMFGNFFANSKSKDTEISTAEILQKYNNKNYVGTFRICPLPKIADSKINSLLQHPYNIFIRKNALLRIFENPKNSQNLYCRVRKIRENQQHVRTANAHFLRTENSPVPTFPAELTVRMIAVEEILENRENDIFQSYFAAGQLHATIYVSENFRRNLKLKIGSKVILEKFTFPEQIVSVVEIFPSKAAVTREMFENYVKRNSRADKILLNSCAELFFDDENSCVVRFSPSDCFSAIFDASTLENVAINVRDVVENLENRLENSDVSEDWDSGNIFIGGLKSVLTECQNVMEISLGLHSSPTLQYDRENILICGKVGSGKTTICHILREHLRGPPNFVHTHVIDCKSLKGKKSEILQKTIMPAVLDCVYHQPAILFLDDLDSIASSSSNEEENTPDALNSARIADLLINIISEYQLLYHMAVVATCTNVNKINQKLVAPRGVHLFRTIFAIPDFEKDERIGLLKLALKSRLNLSDDLNWDYYGNKTEAWTAQDLVDFSDKAAFSAWKRHVENGNKTPLTLFDEDLSRSLDKSTPMSLQGVHLYRGPGHTWSDIGGLANVKQSLVELLHWPLKYPELFQNAPIRHQGGVLLYGAPGTGKTMLAGAIARECGLNFISVKGPELLSKYIGASEEAVRNIFEKAQSAKPCVLFFDEFDSLAPRRGHDSTGVTDRVVNQLLTQLDGVEGRQRVAVVAATSRPDLLDPALLRPGRLDKALFCPLPNKDDRKEILLALCKAEDLDNDCLDLELLATMTQGYTGADLNAVISQAKLAALEEAIAIAKTEDRTEIDKVIVTQENLLDSFRSTRSSLSSEEKAKYDRIYARFSKGDNFSDVARQKQRATLA